MRKSYALACRLAQHQVAQMCGRYVSPEEAAIERYWHIGARDSNRWIRRSFNVAPTATVPIVLNDENGAVEVIPARWGLIPTWWKDTRPPRLSFNARSEEAAVKPMWRQSYRSMRCLMPAQGWYEWNENEPTRDLSGRKVHQPYYIHCSSEPVIAFAGLWSTWHGPGGQGLVSCALLTREAAPAIREIHSRMPVVLAPENFAAWLSASTTNQEVAVLVEHARQDFVGYPVSTQVNNAGNDFPELLQELQA